MLRIQPVRRRAAPRYPTHDYLKDHPELLAIVPERWRQSPLALRVLGGAVCLMLMSQTPSEGQRSASGAPSRIAPLFTHGDGRGAFGCIAVNPPVFLSEDEARQAIRDEGRKAGLDFVPDGFTIHEASVPITDPFLCLYPPGSPRTQRRLPASAKRDLVLDGFDGTHQVGYEFVSEQDFIAWERKNPECVSSVSSFAMKGTAEALRSGLESEPGLPWLGVFYEPAASVATVSEAAPARSEREWQARWEERRRAGRKLGEEELRKQVRDFIAWLKAQGVI